MANPQLRRWRAVANFPSLKSGDANQSVIVESGTWAAAYGNAARSLRRLPALKRKRIKHVSIMLTLLGPVEGGSREQQQSAEQAQLPIPAETPTVEGQ